MTKITSYPAEPSDVKHFISAENKKNDHHLHTILTFDNHLNISTLKKAVVLSTQRLPLLLCHFKETNHGAFWQESVFSADDLVEVIETSVPEQKVNQAIVKKLSTENGPQIRLTIVRTKTSDQLVIVMNHMLADGAGFKEYLYLLSNLYSKSLDNPGYQAKLIPGSRSLKLVFDQFSSKQKQAILTKKKDQLPIQNPILPLQGDSNNPKIIWTKLSKQKFASFIDYTKQHEATVNDALFAAMALTIHQVTNQTAMSIDCPVDLRKYLPEDTVPGITNLTANITCHITTNDKLTSFESTLQTVKKSLQPQKNSLDALRIYYLLEIIFKKKPYIVAKKASEKLYSIPKISFTNIGIINDEKLIFQGSILKDCFICGSLKYAPFFQVAATTFRGELTLSINLHGTKEDHAWQAEFLNKMLQQFPDNSKGSRS
ncbi:condensation domain-containing protein [Listeria ivanovii]|uniref:Putative module of peptide synthetase n=1 Tax=Listeria ivanovii (strain ATCC BAA-678 / PAM 55) TaxID=881621 RepID=G2Z9Z9_LISIP|nr:condensation domain-containing protein [Listeria ivanovii]AHI54963.1 module of peptide synthetase [Listeria ivanovii WSLC3009]AIS64419.1 module of peptide synthetase [Listeria ivanovii subsp. ivanovii]MBK3915251.1 module of peptide synthetase [Listeria ivanovii subsp. ivanovii]MBK3922378.1 module of peptide synthetase [Listeria ivanovii subsp. ivanovii]MBK3927539.1 module of peptide synthetase [Listeria ivanovii subsp. ivanovii]